jgi:hypothetical protein
VDIVWTCKCCGKQYDTLSFAYALDEPDPWRAVPEDERRSRGVLGTDSCTIDGRHHFVRGRIVIPVIGSEAPFIWGVWASVSKADFERFGRLWDLKIRDHEAPLAGRLGNDIPLYPQTFDLACRVVFKNERRRPSFELEATDHPLAIEQRNGITLNRVEEIAAAVQRHSA